MYAGSALAISSNGKVAMALLCQAKSKTPEPSADPPGSETQQTRNLTCWRVPGMQTMGTGRARLSHCWTVRGSPATSGVLPRKIDPGKPVWLDFRGKKLGEQAIVDGTVDPRNRIQETDGTNNHFNSRY